MRTVRVSLWGQLKLLAQADSVDLSISEPYTIKNAFRCLADSHEALRDLLVSDGGTRCSSILVFVDGVQWPCDAEKSLEEGMEITLMSPIAGGQR
jgi:molybdopterin converting factor small subunit